MIIIHSTFLLNLKSIKTKIKPIQNNKCIVLVYFHALKIVQRFHFLKNRRQMGKKTQKILLVEFDQLLPLEVEIFASYLLN